MKKALIRSNFLKVLFWQFAFDTFGLVIETTLSTVLLVVYAVIIFSVDQCYIFF